MNWITAEKLFWIGILIIFIGVVITYNLSMIYGLIVLGSGAILSSVMYIIADDYEDFDDNELGM